MIEEEIKTTTAYTDYIEFFNQAWQFFNKELASNEAPNVVITIQSKNRKPAFGWFGNSFWKDNKDNFFGEVNLSAEYLNRSIEDLLETLIHEMVHSINAKNKVIDCNTMNQYHNKAFKRTAESLGLIVSKMPGKGYALTSLGDKAKSCVDEFLKIKTQPLITINRVNTRGTGVTPINKQYFVPATEADKDWVDSRAEEFEVSRKEVLSELITFFTTHNITEDAQEVNT